MNLMRLTPRPIRRFIANLISWLSRLYGVEVKITKAKRNPRGAIDTTSREGAEAFYADPEIARRWGERRREHLFESIIQYAQESHVDCAGKSVVDIGCGTGHLMQMLNETFHPSSLTGLEQSQNAIRVARDLLPTAQFYCCDITNRNGLHQFDVLFCVEVLEHLLSPDKALENILNLMHPLSVSILTVPNGRMDTAGGHINFWSPESWRAFLEHTANGYDITTDQIRDGRLNIAVIKTRMLERDYAKEIHEDTSQQTVSALDRAM